VNPMTQPPLLSTSTETLTPTKDVGRGRRRPHLGLHRFSGIYVLFVLLLIFSLWIPASFLQASTFQSVLTGQAIVGMAAMAVLVPLAASAFDLSVAAVITPAVVLVAHFQSAQGWPPATAIVVTILICVVIGVVNGFAVVVLEVNSFIATLAMSSILAALVFWISGGQQIVTGISSSFINLGQAQLFGVALPVYYLAALSILLYVVLQHTPLGRYFYAVGENPDAARLAGVRVGQTTFLSLVFSSSIAGCAGVVLCARIGSASLEAGTPYLLPAFAAAFLGSTQIIPGRMNVWGTVLAVYLLAVGVKGLQLAGAEPWVDKLFNGTALLIAVSVSVYGSKRQSRHT